MAMSSRPHTRKRSLVFVDGSVAAQQKLALCQQSRNLEESQVGSDYYAGSPVARLHTHEEEITSWDLFKEKLRDLFGNPLGRQLNAKKALATRVQTSTESYMSYIFDVFALCSKADPNKLEDEKDPLLDVHEPTRVHVLEGRVPPLASYVYVELHGPEPQVLLLDVLEPTLLHVAEAQDPLLDVHEPTRLHILEGRVPPLASYVCVELHGPEPQVLLLDVHEPTRLPVLEGRVPPLASYVYVELHGPEPQVLRLDVHEPTRLPVLEGRVPPLASYVYVELHGPEPQVLLLDVLEPTLLHVAEVQDPLLDVDASKRLRVLEVWNPLLDADVSKRLRVGELNLDPLRVADVYVLRRELFSAQPCLQRCSRFC
ncbi:uncharacterized protein LOC125947271 [Dermacentor silvarum]|uniref:uncharacterized protein LOC125947271 n=1 Tax=Dermacentor silvarum TaxID=543639 RepID=UPI002100E3E6|nr:uncharacterized protein LOC125947271 [Dermacentor silvarum]